MADTPEKKVKRNVVSLLKGMGAYHFFPTTGGYGASGVFDIVVCHNGFFIGIECKADAGKKGPTKLQSYMARLSKASGAIVLVIDANNCNQLCKMLETLGDHKDDSRERSDRLSVWPFDGVAP